MRLKLLAGLLFVGLLLAACSAANNPKYIDVPAGLWDGVWHGLTAGLILLWDTFFTVENPMLYAAVNVGYWYNCGFFCIAPLIVGALWGLGIGALRAVSD